MFEKLVPGQEIESTVVAINGDTIFIDMSAKSEGVIASAEFADANGNLSVKEGDKIKAYFIGEKNGEMRFTTKIAGDAADDSMLENAFKNHIPVEGHVEKEIKGGFEVTIGGKRSFCPYSQMGFRQKEEPAYYVGRTLSFIISEYKEGGKNILVSNRKVMEAEYQDQLSGLSSKITVGSVVTGTVKEIASFGAFIDIDGFQALIPISEIGYERVADVHDVLSVGDEVTGKVINADWSRERVSVSLKALKKSPWDAAAERIKEGDKIDGTISKVADFGFFVQLEPGIDGLVHVSTLEDVDRNTNLKKVYKIGQKFSVVVKSIDAASKRISLIPATTTEQDAIAASYLGSQDDDGDTYNPFAALLKK
ncbi:MAG: S1 RNA-binding domain-containing protein [Treponema sp.]|nr:S1 RNA-binding domain-containing protein [Treponema sp.]